MIIAARRKINFLVYKIFLIILFQVFSLPVLAQKVNIQTSVDKEEIVIGEYIQFSLNIYIPKGTAIHYPRFHNNQLHNFEIIESGVVDTIFNSNESITLRQGIIITSYDTGLHVLPAINVPYYYGDTYDTATAKHVNIKVAGVAVDYEQDIKDIRPPVDVAFNWSELIPYLFYIISFILLIGGSIYAWIYFKKNNEVEQDTVSSELAEPAHIVALRQLEALQQDKLLEKNHVREYHSRLTDHIRRYIQNRFEVQAMEKTSEEILHYFKTEKIDNQSFDALKKILVLADQVKFAKVKPSNKENAQSLDFAFNFVNKTKDIIVLQKSIRG
jgi:hypothetical protein